jgi:NADPH2:quinone reductase
MPANLLVLVPEWVNPETAAAVLVKGMTTEVLVTRCAKVQPGQIALVHAASGGVGSILVQWLKATGAFVIAHAGSEAKAERAKSLGADEALFCSYADLPDEVRRVTGKHRADVIFEGVGAASWAASMKSVAKRGLIVSFGNASGRPPEITTRQLSEAGSIFVTRPNMFHYNDTQERKRAGAQRVFDMIRDGKLRVDIGQRFPLSAAPDAHRALESRTTMGSTVLYVD